MHVKLIEIDINQQAALFIFPSAEDAELALKRLRTAIKLNRQTDLKAITVLLPLATPVDKATL